MSTAQPTQTFDTVKTLSDHRDDARILLQCQEAIIAEYQRIFKPDAFGKAIARTRELMADLQDWIEGGQAPASAHRYVGLMRWYEEHSFICETLVSEPCSCHECTTLAELDQSYRILDTVGDATHTCLEWAVGNTNITLERAIEMAIGLATQLENPFCSDFGASIEETVRAAAESAKPGLKLYCSSEEADDSAADNGAECSDEARVASLAATINARANAAVRDRSLFWLFPLDEYGCLPSRVCSNGSARNRVVADGEKAPGLDGRGEYGRCQS